jgi:phosphoglycerate dehydrogenase-like enzyme
MVAPVTAPRLKVAILDDYGHVALDAADWSPVAALADITVFDRPFTLDEAADALQDFEILCTLRERQPFPRSLIERLPKLRYICVTGKRYDTVDVAAATERGVLVTNTPVAGAGQGGVAELTWGLILAVARNIPREDHLMRQGEWQHGLGMTLRGKTLGIVGLGSIGADVARIGRCFGMNVIAWSPNLTTERAGEAGVTAVSKDQLFASSDVVTLHLALGDCTRHIVGATEIASMRASAILVNTARAGLIDEDALLRALETSKIAGAGVDVFSDEPLPRSHRFRTEDKAVITPHLGYYTHEMIGAYYTFAVENISSFIMKKPLRLVAESNPGIL